MAFVTLFDDVLFIEGEHPRAEKRYNAQTRVGGFGAQLKNLNDLKQTMAQTAKLNGCNCVVDFRYGQQAKLIAIDDVAFVGDGFYAVLSAADYQAIRTQLLGRP